MGMYLGPRSRIVGYKFGETVAGYIYAYLFYFSDETPSAGVESWITTGVGPYVVGHTATMLICRYKPGLRGENITPEEEQAIQDFVYPEGWNGRGPPSLVRYLLTRYGETQDGYMGIAEETYSELRDNTGNGYDCLGNRNEIMSKMADFQFRFKHPDMQFYFTHLHAPIYAGLLESYPTYMYGMYNLRAALAYSYYQGFADAQGLAVYQDMRTKALELDAVGDDVVVYTPEYYTPDEISVINSMYPLWFAENNPDYVPALTKTVTVSSIVGNVIVDNIELNWKGTEKATFTFTLVSEGTFEVTGANVDSLPDCYINTDYEPVNKFAITTYEELPSTTPYFKIPSGSITGLWIIGEKFTLTTSTDVTRALDNIGNDTRALSAVIGWEDIGPVNKPVYSRYRSRKDIAEVDAIIREVIETYFAGLFTIMPSGAYYFHTTPEMTVYGLDWEPPNSSYPWPPFVEPFNW